MSFEKELTFKFMALFLICLKLETYLWPSKLLQQDFTRSDQEILELL